MRRDSATSAMQSGGRRSLGATGASKLLAVSAALAGCSAQRPADRSPLSADRAPELRHAAARSDIDAVVQVDAAALDVGTEASVRDPFDGASCTATLATRRALFAASDYWERPTSWLAAGSTLRLDRLDPARDRAAGVWNGMRAFRVCADTGGARCGVSFVGRTELAPTCSPIFRNLAVLAECAGACVAITWPSYVAQLRTICRRPGYCRDTESVRTISHRLIAGQSAVFDCTSAHCPLDEATVMTEQLRAERDIRSGQYAEDIDLFEEVVRWHRVGRNVIGIPAFLSR